MSITTALKARREQLRDREAGFTLIELLVVVIIIGILAAIAIPVYIGVQNNARDSAAKSDLTNAKTAEAAYYAQNTAYTATASNLTPFGLPTGTSVYIKTANSNANFCASVLSPTNTVFVITDQAGLTTSAATTAAAACP
jgi:type IV pilus assembly protein PilA